MIRLQKFLASAGVCSRRKAEIYISAGRVSVDGHIVSELGTKIDPANSSVTVDGKLIKEQSSKVYYLLNKPTGFVTTLSDPQGRPVVTSLLKDVKERVFPVGRLDFDTVGALLLTNDGDLAQKIQHPSFETFKTYEATVKGIPTKDKLDKLEKGIVIDNKRTAPAKINTVFQRNSKTVVRLTIHEGRKHQVKKMLGAIGHPVTHLKRTAYGKLKLGKLASGKYIKLSAKQLDLIFLK